MLLKTDRGIGVFGEIHTTSLVAKPFAIWWQKTNFSDAEGSFICRQIKLGRGMRVQRQGQALLKQDLDNKNGSTGMT